MEIVNRKIEELIGADYNPRKISPKQMSDLQTSLQEFGFVDPVIVNRNPDRLDTIVGGHQRVKAWRSLGNETVPTVEVNLTLERERELNIRLNKNTGEFDFNLLSEFFSVKELSDWGFDDLELEQFKDEKSEIKEDHYEVPDELETDIKEGDLFEVFVGGKPTHRFMCGDSTKIEDVQKLMGGAKADLIVTDPPYNVDYEGATKDALKIENDNMSDAKFRKFLKDAYLRMVESTKAGGAIYVFHASSKAYFFMEGLTEAGFLYKQQLIWVKNTMVMGRQDYQWQHEPILYGWKEGGSHYFINDRTQKTVIEDRVDIKKMKKPELMAYVRELQNFNKEPSTILYEDKPSVSAEHPTMKPIKLVARLIRNSSKRYEIVLDLFLGSGSTLIASHQMDRLCYGMELSPKYCWVIVDRIKKLDSTITITRNGEPY